MYNYIEHNFVLQEFKLQDIVYMAGFLSGGAGGAFAPPLALACPPWDFVLTVNQFKCFKSLTVMLCIININNSTHVLHAIMMFIVRDDS